MNDVLGYSGKRVIVTGAASGIGAAAAQLLVELGAEVHAVDAVKPDITGLASFTQGDLRDVAQIEAAVKKIGKVVNGLFNCAGDVRAMTDAVVPHMIEGAAIVSVGPIDEHTVSRSAELAQEGIRINCVVVAAGLADPWPIVFLNSPRASGITGQQLDVSVSRR